MILPGLNFPIYSGWTTYTPVIPKLYYNVYSAEQRIKQLCMNFDKVEHYLDYIAGLMNEWNVEFSDDIEAELKKMWDEIHSGYENALNTWIEEDLPNVIQGAVKQVYFGLNEQGYFVAYIPSSWDDIIFDTGMDYSKADYGRLILRWDTDNTGETVNQTVEERI